MTFQYKNVIQLFRFVLWWLNIFIEIPSKNLYWQLNILNQSLTILNTCYVRKINLRINLIVIDWSETCWGFRHRVAGYGSHNVHAIRVRFPLQGNAKISWAGFTNCFKNISLYLEQLFPCGIWFFLYLCWLHHLHKHKGVALFEDLKNATSITSSPGVKSSDHMIRSWPLIGQS